MSLCRQEFSGRWVVEPDPAVRDSLQFATVLRYELSLVPRWPLPPALVTHVVQAGLPANIRAVARRAEQVPPAFSSRLHSACVGRVADHFACHHSQLAVQTADCAKPFKTVYRLASLADYCWVNRLPSGSSKCRQRGLQLAQRARKDAPPRGGHAAE